MARLVEDLRALGLRAGDRVVVHASIRAIGPVECGPTGAAKALLATVGPRGLVVVPTFSYDSRHFDPASTAGRTGALAETLRGWPGATRSLHPFYSVAAVGPEAADLCEGHELVAGTAAGSPLDRLAEAGGSVLMLGTGHTANTTVHVGEFRADAPYLDIPFDPTWPRAAETRSSSGPPLRVSYDRFPGCSRAFGVLERPLRARGLVRDGRVGRALAQLVPGRALVDETIELLRSDPTALLCSDPACYRCSRARERLSGPGARGRAAGADRAR